MPSGIDVALMFSATLSTPASFSSGSISTEQLSGISIVKDAPSVDTVFRCPSAEVVVMFHLSTSHWSAQVVEIFMGHPANHLPLKSGLTRSNPFRLMEHASIAGLVIRIGDGLPLP